MVKRTVVTMREQVYKILRDEICAGVYPPGYRLQEVELAEHLNVSRSPLREALRQLAGDGLVVEIPNKGVYVKAFTPKDIEEIFDLRIMLETYGIEKSAEKVTSARIKRLLELLGNLETTFDLGDVQAYTAFDEQLHSEIVALAANDLVNEVYGRVRTLNQQFRVLSLTDPQRFNESFDEHRTIIQAIATGDTATAIEAERIHLERARNTIVALMGKNRSVK